MYIFIIHYLHMYYPLFACVGIIDYVDLIDFVNMHDSLRKKPIPL